MMMAVMMVAPVMMMAAVTMMVAPVMMMAAVMVDGNNYDTYHSLRMQGGTGTNKSTQLTRLLLSI